MVNHSRFLHSALLAAGAAILATGPLARTLHAEDFSNAGIGGDWAESSTDASGNYTSPNYNTTIAGGVLSAPIPTDAVQTSPDNDVTNYVRTAVTFGNAATDYDGTLLGNLSTKTAVTATFKVTNSAITPGATFQASQLVGEPGSPADATPSLRIVFTGSQPDLIDDPSGNTPSIWWSNPVGSYLTSMNNGQNVTLTASFDPSQWSNYYGQFANVNPLYTADFEAALADVSRMGISFGSGSYFSTGFGFNTGGTAALELDSISTTPEPASLGVLGAGALALLSRRRRSA